MNLQDFRLEISAIQLPCNDSSLHDEVFLHKILNPPIAPDAVSSVRGCIYDNVAGVSRVFAATSV